MAPIRWLAIAVVALAPALAASARARAATPPPIRHVFVIVLENEDAATSFGPHSAAPYLARTLRRRGVFVPRYYGIGHVSLDNYIAMISGQAPNPQTQTDCQVYTDVAPGRRARHGQVVGSGCVYPASVRTIADQLSAHGLRWKGYMQDMGADPSRESARCGHPRLGTRDETQLATPADQYATRHNPFVYFHSIIDSRACRRRDVALRRLPHDLRRARRTPNLAFITPDLCHDGHDATCPDGGPGGLRAANRFLRAWVPRITRSPAFRRNGLLIVTFDESAGDSSACCHEPTGPNATTPGGPEPGPGGGRVGAVLLSPFLRPGSTTHRAYDHYSLLRSLEDIFGLRHLGYAARRGLRPFGADVYGRHRRSRAAP